MELPLVSVLMPVYNTEKHLRAAIYSILRQSYSNFELIIVNDGSTDATESIILSFNDKRIRYMRNETNLGIPVSSNIGVEAAVGKYIARMDGDDVSYPNRLEKQVNFLEENPEYGLVGCFYHVINGNGMLLNTICKETEDVSIRLGMIFRNQFVQPGIMMRGVIAKELRYDPDFPVCEDHDLWNRILERCKGANLPEILLTYRWYGKNTSITKQRLLLESALRIYSRVLESYNIDHTAEELFIHATMTFSFSKRYFSTEDKIMAGHTWLDKIKSSPKLRMQYGSEVVEKFVEKIRKTVFSGNDISKRG